MMVMRMSVIAVLIAGSRTLTRIATLEVHVVQSCHLDVGFADFGVSIINEAKADTHLGRI